MLTPEHLQCAVRDLHINTWFSIEGLNKIACTESGTNAGTALDGMVFSVAMTKVSNQVKTMMASENISYSISATDCANALTMAVQVLISA